MTIRILGGLGLGAAGVVLALAFSGAPARAGEPPAGVRVPELGRPLAPTARASASANDSWSVYEGKSLRFEQPRYGGEARLFVREDGSVVTTNALDTPGATRWRVYRGNDLDAIVLANSDVASNADFAALRTFVTTNSRAESGPARVTSSIRTSVQAPGLVFEPSAPGTKNMARLYVSDQAGRETLYTGQDFDTIMRANPTFEQIDGFQALRTHVKQVEAITPWNLRADASAVVKVCHTPTGVMVAVHEYREGNWVTRTHQGISMAEVEAGQPSLRALFDGRERAAPSNVPSNQPSDLPSTLPMTLPTTQSQQAWDVQPYGLTLETTTACLDSQLQLEGRGVVVTKVREGSTASSLGLRDYDVIVEFDGRAVSGGEWLRGQLDGRRSDVQTRMVVLRHGSRVTLNS